MPILIYLAAALCLGVLLAFQPLMNGILARAIGNSFGAAAISVFVAAVGALAMILVAGRGDTSRAALAAVPWWVFLAGLVGTAFVAGAVVIAPITGALVFFVCIVAGQMLGSVVADHFGLFGLDLRPVSLERLIGLALVIGGAVLVQRG